MNAAFDRLLEEIDRECRRYYGDRLMSVAVFGSVGRGTPRHNSDVDLLVVADALPRGRVPRVEEFSKIEAALVPAMHRSGLQTSLSPVIKTPDEVRQRSPLFLDMTEDARCLFDRGGFLAGELAKLRSRLTELGARRIWRGNAWYWDLKPDFQPGEIIEL